MIHLLMLKCSASADYAMMRDMAYGEGCMLLLSAPFGTKAHIIEAKIFGIIFS